MCSYTSVVYGEAQEALWGVTCSTTFTVYLCYFLRERIHTARQQANFHYLPWFPALLLPSRAPYSQPAVNANEIFLGLFLPLFVLCLTLSGLLKDSRRMMCFGKRCLLSVGYWVFTLSNASQAAALQMNLKLFKCSVRVESASVFNCLAEFFSQWVCQHVGLQTFLPMSKGSEFVLRSLLTQEAACKRPEEHLNYKSGIWIHLRLLMHFIPSKFSEWCNNHTLTHKYLSRWNAFLHLSPSFWAFQWIINRGRFSNCVEY